MLTPPERARPRDPQPRDTQTPPLHPEDEPIISTPDEVVDRESEDSFPASDPPSSTPLHIGEPAKEPANVPPRK